MKQVIWIISCYLYGAAVILLVILLLLVYLRGQVNHLPNPFAKKNLAYRQPAQARGILFGKKLSLLAYSPEQDEGHILVMGPSGTGKTSALLIPTLRSWQGTALVVDISGDISANVKTPNKIIFDPTAENCIPYDVFASINAVVDETERQERLEQLAYLLLPDKANDSEAGIFFTKNGRKMITAALICYYGMGWGFVQICEFFLGHDWRGLLNDIAKQQNPIANMFISSFVGASEQNTAGCKQAADDALKLFAANEKIKNALRKSARRSTKSTVTSGTAFGLAAVCTSMCRFLLSPTERTRNTTPTRPATATLKRAPERPERAAKRQATALNLRPFGRMEKTASFPIWWTLPARSLPAIRC